MALSTIKRFKQLKTNIKLHLVKACILPIFTYLAYPLNTLSKTAILSLQAIQNKALRFAYEEKYSYTKTTVRLHQMAAIQPTNLSLYDNGKTHTHKNKFINLIKNTTYINQINNRDNGWDHH